MKRHEMFEHTADLGYTAYGADLPEAFAAAGEALFDIITGGAQIRSDVETSFGVESVDLEGLLVGFLSELLVKFEVEQLVLTDFDVVLHSSTKLTARARGERFDEKRHGHGHHVKGVSYHLMEIVDNADRDDESYASVLLDV
jgi:SHS2 domain-containing protein